MKRFTASLALFAVLCVVVLLSGCSTAQAPSTTPSPTSMPRLGTPVPTASPAARALSYKAKATPQTPKPVVTYNPTPTIQATKTPIIVVGTDPLPCRLDVLVDEKLSNEQRLQEAYRFGGCDYGWLLYMSDLRNCSEPMKVCYERFLDLDSTLYPPELPAPRE